MTNRYFIIDYPVTDLSIWQIVVQDADTVRKNNSGNLCIVKLYQGDTSDHAQLQNYTEYTHEQMLTFLNGNIEWN